MVTTPTYEKTEIAIGFETSIENLPSIEDKAT